MGSALVEARRSTEPILLVGALVALGAACLAVAVWPAPIAVAPPGATVPWLALVAAFVIGDRVDVSLEVRDHAIAVTPAHFVLVFGLFTAAAPALVSARVVGGALALALLREEREPVKLAFNVALYLFEAASACAVVRVTPWWTASAFDARNWAVVFAAMVAYTTVALVLILAAIRVSSLDPRPLTFARPWGLATLAETANAALGLVAAVLWQAAPWALLLLAPPATVTYLAYLGYSRLAGRHQYLERLYDFTGKIAQANDIDAAIDVTLREAANVLHARWAEVLVLSGGKVVRWRALDGSGVLCAPVQYPRWETDPVLAHAVEARDAVFRHNGLVRSNPRHGDTLCVPMLAGTALVGVVVVRERSGPSELFDRADATALSALANHAAMSLENLRLIEQLRDEAHEREQLALHDSLTGLGNRRLFHRSLSEAMSARWAEGPHVVPGPDGIDLARREDALGVAVLLVDLDGFKNVNDTLGHDAGDRLLQAVAARLKTYAGPGALVARLGGDEFAVLVSPSSVHEASLLADRLLRVVEQPVRIDGLQLVISAGVGVACAPDHATDEASLLQRADLALYAAKARPDVSIEVFQRAHGERSARRLTMASDLRHALERGALEVHYKPQIELSTKRVIATEALLRWRHPELGDVEPAEFVSVAEHLGLVDRLTRYVLERAVSQAAAWRRDGLDLEMAVNISVRNLLEPDFPEQLASILARHQLSPRRITLEITETELMHEAGRAEEVLARLHRLGVGLSIDDFGTGYSSLAYLKRLPVAELKLDRSFVRDLAQDASDAMIARTVIDLAGNLELRVVAEGIEDADALDALMGMGCDRGQGYLLSRPLPPEELWAWAKLHCDLLLL
ncbi:MAG: EAL domain-containing protein [Acidimicrobiales bacterium]|nr:EAL domain-containing protein [Acidimicrobiales bacterium]